MRFAWYAGAGANVCWSFRVCGWHNASAFLVLFRLEFLVVLECQLFSISLSLVLFDDFFVWGGVGRYFTELEVKWCFAVNLLFCGGVFVVFCSLIYIFLLIAGVQKVVAGVEKVWRAPGKVGEVGDHVSGRILIRPTFSVFFNTSISIFGNFVNFFGILWHFLEDFFRGFRVYGIF